MCPSAHVNCGETADLIRMPFGVVSGLGLGMGVLDFGGDRRRGRGKNATKQTPQLWLCRRSPGCHVLAAAHGTGVVDAVRP